MTHNMPPSSILYLVGCFPSHKWKRYMSASIQLWIISREICGRKSVPPKSLQPSGWCDWNAKSDFSPEQKMNGKQKLPPTSETTKKLVQLLSDVHLFTSICLVPDLFGGNFYSYKTVIPWKSYHGYPNFKWFVQGRLSLSNFKYIIGG